MYVFVMFAQQSSALPLHTMAPSHLTHLPSSTTFVTSTAAAVALVAALPRTLDLHTSFSATETATISPTAAIAPAPAPAPASAPKEAAAITMGEDDTNCSDLERAAQTWLDLVWGSEEARVRVVMAALDANQA
jgi:hypothetical protein